MKNVSSFCGHLAGAVLLSAVSLLQAEGVKYDPTKILDVQTCVDCHKNEVDVWQKTPHYTTWEELHRRDSAKDIAKRMEVRSIKRGDLCLQCHYTQHGEAGSDPKPVAGVSCQSCHGPAADWLKLHNDYGGPDVKKEQETPEHRLERIKKSLEAGMLHPSNIYLVAQNCYNCHSVPNEKLVNVGEHKAGSDSFELVAWSQGLVRHNFLRTAGASNATNPPERLRVMYAVGALTDLEYSLRGLAKATEDGAFAQAMTARVQKAVERLKAIQEKAATDQVAAALKAVEGVELKAAQAAACEAAADKVQAEAKGFGPAHDGSGLAALDELLPKPEQYKNEPTPR